MSLSTPMSPNPTLLIMAGGTGGHIMPGLAIAEVMRLRGWNVRWLGTAHGMENTLVPQAGIPLDTIPFAGLRGKGLRQSFIGALQLIGGFFRSLKLIGAMQPAVALGMGGYVTVPGGLALALRRVPLALMNSDSALLLSNRMLLPFTRRILFGLPGHAEDVGSKALWTGSPVRAEISAIEAPAQRYAGRSGPLRILVAGGSLGATVLNRNIPLALARLPLAERPLVTHQCGAANVEVVQAMYRDLDLSAEVLPFIDDMARRYAEADMVVCRAGAITVNELCVAGIAAILVPLTVSTTAHQRDNARYMAQAGAAIHLEQSELNPEHLAGMITGLTRARLQTIAEAARALGKPAATDTVADILEELAGSRA